MSNRTPNLQHRSARRLRAAIAAAIVLAVVASVVLVESPRIVGDASDARTAADFFTQPAGATNGTPGTLVKVQPLLGTPPLSRAWRIMYRSTDLNGAPIVATAIVVRPLGGAPAGGRTVLAWGHPTTGTALLCAPSRGFDPFTGIEGLRLMLTRGYTVVAPDFAGMGTDGPNSYLVGQTAAHTMLDAIRAAQRIPAMQASNRVVMWGHSQGGQAVLFAAQDAPTYASSLKILGVAAAAPAADLNALMKAHQNDISGVTIGSYAFPAFQSVYGATTPGLRLSDVLSPAAIRNLPEMNSLCLLPNLSRLHTIGQPLVGSFFTKDPTVTQPWANLLAENSAGQVPISAPVFIAQGESDKLIPPAVTAAFVKRERALGMDVTFTRVPFATHSTIAYLSLPALNNWLNSIGA